MDEGKDLGVGIGFRRGDPDVADRQTDLTSDLEKLQTDGPALGMGHRGIFEPEASQGMHEHVRS